MPQVIGYHRGVPIYPLSQRSPFRGLTRGGKIFVKDSLPLQEKLLTYEHEYRHLKFNERHHILGSVFGNPLVQFAGLFLYGLSLYLGLYPLVAVSLTPWFCVLLQELYIYASMGDPSMLRTMLSLMFPVALIGLVASGL